MSARKTLEPFPTVIIGGGQAGLAVAAYLTQVGHTFVILDAHERPGDSWRKRWDSLRLFTPAAFASLPGMPFPAVPNHYPHKDEMADYLEAYAKHFALPIRHKTKVTRLEPSATGFIVTSTQGRMVAQQMVVATGAHQVPHVPAWSSELSADIPQLHSSQYRSPDALPAGPVLLVGAGNSGMQIGLELARTREVYLAGHNPGVVPARPRWLIHLFRRTIMNMSVDSPWGGIIKTRGLTRGTPVMGLTERHLARAGVRRLGRVVGAHRGRPTLADGRLLELASIIWCTGFKPDFSWIDALKLDPHGYPQHHRGVAEHVPGLYFVGLPFLSRLNSGLIAGVGPDARHIAEHLIARHRTEHAKATGAG